MIISKTPYRVSFFGGGTDYHTWYQNHGGKVLSTTINHYSYLHTRFLPPFFSHKHRVVWKQVEEVSMASQIEHPSVRACLEYLEIKRGIEIHHQGSLPSRSGLGSSSAFTVGLLNTLYALRQEMSSKKDLACEAVHVERDLLKENVGVQDQIAASYGGLNKITIDQSGDFCVDPVIISRERKKELESHCLLFFTGISRTASQIAEKKIGAIGKKSADLNEMMAMVEDGIDILSKGNDVRDFGRLLHESWLLKRGIVSDISNDVIDTMYKKAIGAGAIGGKLLGAGGGGFMLFFVEPEKHSAVLSALEDFLLVPIEFENNGSKIIYYDADSYTRTSIIRRDYAHLKDDKKKVSKRKNKLTIIK